MASAMPTGRPSPNRSCVLPWALLAVVVLGLLGTAFWAYRHPRTVAQFALASVLEEELQKFDPTGERAPKWAGRLSAVLVALREGRVDPERMAGGAARFRECYADRKLDSDEFESLLALAEGAVEP